MDVPNAGAMVANISKLIPRSDDEDGADRAFDEDNMVLMDSEVVAWLEENRLSSYTHQIARFGTQDNWLRWSTLAGICLRGTCSSVL